MYIYVIYMCVYMNMYVGRITRSNKIRKSKVCKYDRSKENRKNTIDFINAC